MNPLPLNRQNYTNSTHGSKNTQRREPNPEHQNLFHANVEDQFK